MEDFNWAKDIKPNPLLYGDNVVVWLDRLITKDESKTLLDFVRQVGIEVYNYGPTVNTLVRYSKTNNGYIRVVDGSLGYGSSKGTFNSITGDEQYVEYSVSDLFGSTMNEECDDFNWAMEIEESEYYVIDSDAYNQNARNHKAELTNNEWVLIQITGRDEVNLNYSVVHYNLRCDTGFSAPIKDSYVTHDWFEHLVSTGYWKRYHTKPTPTLFNHKNNEILKRYEKN